MYFYRMSTHAIRCPFNKLTDYGYSAFYKIIADGSRVKIAAAFTNDLLSIQQKAIFKQIGEIAQPLAGRDGRWFGAFWSK